MSNKAHSKQKSRRHLSQPHSGDRTNGLQIALGLRTPRRISARLRSRHSALTLVELLVTIGLITVVSSMFLVAYRAAATEASNIRTQGTIRKISEVLMARMQEYENYPINFVFPNDPQVRVPFSTPMPNDARELLSPSDPGFEPKGILLERARMVLLRELVVKEMPDNIDDIKPSPGLAYSSRDFWTGLIARNPQNNQMARIFVSASESSRAERIKRKLTEVDVNWRTSLIPKSFFNAELLYLIVEDSTINGSSAMELFGKSEIGDKDGDKLNEFLDANGEPIGWLRWPSGFDGVVRTYPDLLEPAFNKADGTGDEFSVFGDPLDPRRADPAFRVPVNGDRVPIIPSESLPFPLVISSGPDRRFGIRFELDPTLSFGTNNDLYAIRSNSSSDVLMPVPYNQRINGGAPLVMPDPWFPRRDPDSLQRLGRVINAKAFEDDITNYAINGAY